MIPVHFVVSRNTFRSDQLVSSNYFLSLEYSLEGREDLCVCVGGGGGG